MDFLFLESFLKGVLNLVSRFGVHIHVKVTEEHVPKVLIAVVDVLQ